MTVFESPWFLRMVESQTTRPRERLIAVFRVAEQWISAPGMRELLQQQYGDSRPTLLGDTPLRRFLVETASATRAADPITLASQLIILLQGALAEELRDADAQALRGATQAAQAIVHASCQESARHPGYRNLVVGAIAAASMCALSLPLFHDGVGPKMPSLPRDEPSLTITSTQTPGISPDTLKAMLVLHHRLETGICPVPQQLAMNDQQIAGYQTIVHFQNGHPRDINWQDARAFMDWYGNTLATACYMPPSNGHTNVAWVSRTTSAPTRESH